MRLTQHVYLLSGFPYGLHPNVYGIDAGDELVLVDTGLNEEDMTCIRSRIRDWDLAHLPIRHVFITHSHFDHAGNAARLRRDGAQIIAGDGDAQGIALGDARTIAYTYSMPFPCCEVDRIVRDGATVEAGSVTVETIAVPGHSRGSVAYRACVDERDVLFTGDFIRVGDNCQSAMLGFSGAEDFDPDVYMQSLKKIRQWHPDIVLGGHAQPCLADGWKVLDKAYTWALVNWRTPSVQG